MTHDLLIFDLDGTLSDPILGIGRSLNYALVHFGYAPVEDSTVAVYVGPPLDEAFKGITGSTSSSHIAELVAKYRERYTDVGYSENVLYPGISEALARLKQTGTPLAVCTSKRVDFAERILEMFGLRSHFQFVNGGDIGIQKRQQLAGLLAQGVITQSSVMIGDRAIDLTSAHGNGLSAAGVLWGYGSREELTKENPRHLFQSPEELCALASN